jgi:hypothetical protein
VRRLEPPRLAAGFVALLCAGVLAVGWHGATSSGPEGGYDADAFIAYSAFLGSEHRLPGEEDTYEYATPPLYPTLAGAVQKLADHTGSAASRVVPSGFDPWWRLGWLALVAAAVGLLVGFGRPHPAWAAGVAAAAVAAGWAILTALATAHDVRWTAGQAVSLAWAAGLVTASWLLAREVWPRRTLLPALAALAAAAVPLVVRLGAMVHPEMELACLVTVALLLVVRAGRTRWPAGTAAALGAVLGLAGLTRPTSGIVIAALAVTALVAGRREALRFVAVAGLVTLLVAGVWWARQAAVYGNPLQANLDRYAIAGGQPLSFYVSFPIDDLVLRPYRPHFAGELLPQVHADLWSDWFGAQHAFWGHGPGDATRAFLSGQSVLGFVFELTAVGGLLAAGVPAVRRVARRQERDGDDAWSAFLLLVLFSWAAFVAALVRYPQEGGDPIKASYMLYLTPVFAIALVEAARRLWGRGPAWRAVLACWAVLFAASSAGYLVTAYPG